MIKILIIDDEKEIREGLKEYVTDEYDCWVDLASNGDGGLRLCQKKQYDIIFTDYLFLSKEDGFTFLSKIKQMEEQSITVLISGYIFTHEDAKGRSVGGDFDEFLAKPFSNDAVGKIIDKYFPGNKK
ncbi:MAG: response regulator [Candidatus Omnitrophica bacterium]|nr:response regulator [Candidatus Omnitrophota bacterium]